MKTKILPDFQICISVPLNENILIILLKYLNSNKNDIKLYMAIPVLFLNLQISENSQKVADLHSNFLSKMYPTTVFS